MTNRIIHTSDDLPRDHWIARQLPAGTSLRPYAEDEAMTVLTSAAEDAIDEAGLTRAQVAELLGNTRSYVSQVLSGRTNMTLKTLGALFWAAGRQIAEIRTEPIGTMPSAHQPEATTSVFNQSYARFVVRTVSGGSINVTGTRPQRWDALQPPTTFVY